MNAKEIVENNKILESHIGSKLYGTDLPSSDEDYAGVFIPPKDILYGLVTIEQVDNSIIDKNENDKNTKEAIDSVFYSLHKFVNLSIGGSPNMIERLFVPENKITFINKFGYRLLEMKHNFLSKRIIPRFLGYSVSQRHKMIIRTDNFHILNAFSEYLNKFESRQVLIEIKNDGKNHELFGYFKGDLFVCGDLNLNRTILIKDAKRIVDERISKVSNRKELILKHGFDTKFASHLIRLLLECKEILETEDLIFPLSYSEHIKDIKIGKYSLNDVLDEAETIEKEINDIKDSCKLIENPDFNKINSFVIDLTNDFITEKI